MLVLRSASFFLTLDSKTPLNPLHDSKSAGDTAPPTGWPPTKQTITRALQSQGLDKNMQRWYTNFVSRHCTHF